MKDGEERNKALWESVREMIDGQQRSRTIIDFINDKFRTSDNTTVKIEYVNGYSEDVPIGGLTYSEIKNKYVDVADKFNDTELSFVVCYSQMEASIHQLFLDLNDLNAMTPQEQRNAKVTDVADFIRDSARLDTHKLFKRDDELNGIFIKLRGKFKKMMQDEVLAQIVAYIEGSGKDNGVGKATLDKLYDNSDYKIELVGKKKVVKLLDQLHTILESKNYRKITTIGVTLNLMLITDWCINNHVRVNWNTFRDWFFETHDKLTKRTKEEKAAGAKDSMYSLYTRLDTTASGLEVRLAYFLDKLSEVDGIIFKDPKRVISDAEMVHKWFAVGQMCEHSGCEEKITLDQVKKAHIKAHSSGGETTVENTFVSCKVHNRLEIAEAKI
jgi:hypothetical protein